MTLMKNASIPQMAVMGMGVKCGDTVTVSVDGADEETAFAEMQAFFQQNL
ncbi:HPr family phosphocarrier protein [Ruminococcus callidus]